MTTLSIANRAPVGPDMSAYWLNGLMAAAPADAIVQRIEVLSGADGYRRFTFEHENSLEQVIVVEDEQQGPAFDIDRVTYRFDGGQVINVAPDPNTSIPYTQLFCGQLTFLSV